MIKGVIRLADIIDESIVDGVGVRLVVFLQGCLNNCQGCHNPDLKPVDGGRSVSEEELAELIIAKLSPIHRGITFSGGEPMLQADSLVSVISRIKGKKANLDFWLYTGYYFEEVSQHPVMDLIDVVVDGPFIPSKRDATCVFYGSANQRIIDVPESLRLGQTVLFELESVLK